MRHKHAKITTKVPLSCWFHRFFIQGFKHLLHQLLPHFFQKQLVQRCPRLAPQSAQDESLPKPVGDPPKELAAIFENMFDYDNE